MTSNGVLLDGRNRIEIGSALEKHLSAGYKAMIAEKIANLPNGVRADSASSYLHKSA